MAVCFAALAPAVAGCGGGEVAAEEVPGSPPALIVPSDSELGAAGSSADEATGNANEDANPDAGAADSAAPDPGSADPPADTSGGTAVPEATPEPTVTEDTTTEEAPPPAGSPPEQFEDFCAQNEGAC